MKPLTDRIVPRDDFKCAGKYCTERVSTHGWYCGACIGQQYRERLSIELQHQKQRAEKSAC